MNEDYEEELKSYYGCAKSRRASLLHEMITLLAMSSLEGQPIGKKNCCWLSRRPARPNEVGPSSGHRHAGALLRQRTLVQDGKRRSIYPDIPTEKFRRWGAKAKDATRSKST